MSTKKEIWRLLEPGDVWQEGDQYFNGSIESWENSTSRIWGSPAGHYDKPARRRITLPEPQGWISVKERMPTKEDAGSLMQVLWLFDTGSIVSGDWSGFDGVDPTHWSHIPEIPDGFRNLDEEAFQKWRSYVEDYQDWGARGDEVARFAFMAGRKSVAAEKEGEV